MGSEIGFMRGTAEHAGNRNYVGQERLDAAVNHPIQQALTDIANVRKNTPALQRGIQVNVALSGHTAAFYRVINTEESQQTALVLLNKGDSAQTFNVNQFIQSGNWVEQLTGRELTIAEGGKLSATVEPNGVQVWLREGKVENEALLAQIKYQLSRQYRSVIFYYLDVIA